MKCEQLEREQRIVQQFHLVGWIPVDFFFFSLLFRWVSFTFGLVVFCSYVFWLQLCAVVFCFLLLCFFAAAAAFAYVAVNIVCTAASFSSLMSFIFLVVKCIQLLLSFYSDAFHERFSM